MVLNSRLDKPWKKRYKGIIPFSIFFSHFPFLFHLFESIPSEVAWARLTEFWHFFRLALWSLKEHQPASIQKVCKSGWSRNELSFFTFLKACVMLMSSLLSQAILLESPSRQLSLGDIYKWFTTNFKYFRTTSNLTWKVKINKESFQFFCTTDTNMMYTRKVDQFCWIFSFMNWSSFSTAHVWYLFLKIEDSISTDNWEFEFYRQFHGSQSHKVYVPQSSSAFPLFGSILA